VRRGALECDILVIGAGPAGAAAAQLLASWGRSVILVHRAGAPRHSLAESLPSSTRKLLRLLGQLDRVDAADLYPNNGNVAQWAGAPRMTTSAGSGFHVSRAVFDALLRDSARSAGARTLDAIVQHVGDADPVAVTCVASAGGNDRIVCHARYVLDCSGRAGVVARRGLRRNGAPYRTLAIVAEWQSDEWPVDERTRTTVESYRDGWAWSVPLSATRRQCTVMVDGERSTGSSALQVKYAAELAKAPALSARLAGARQTSAPWTCDASIYDSTRAADGRVLLVGDAASFIDPLSSAGVKKALLSAWRAAVVANTCLADSSMAPAAMELHSRRERQVFADCSRRSAVFVAEAAAAYSTSFWSARAMCSSVGAPAPGAADDIADDELARDPELRDAFERLRSGAHVRLRTATTLQFEPIAAIEGRRVVMREAIVVPGGDAPLHFAAGVDLPALARLARDGGEVPALIEAFHAQVGPAPLGGLLAGLSLLVARQALVAEDSPS
jgi:flavin-dependent dehydrogenase